MTSYKLIFQSATHILDDIHAFSPAALAHLITQRLLQDGKRLHLWWSLFPYQREPHSQSRLAIIPWNDLCYTGWIHCSCSSSNVKMPDTCNRLPCVTTSTWQVVKPGSYNPINSTGWCHRFHIGQKGYILRFYFKRGAVRCPKLVISR